jgi:hypothetical protein
MQYLNGSYTSYFNRRHRRAGHLFQGRFKGHLIEEQGYFLEVSRYIHLNPVRAKAVARPEDYRYSSYPGYVRAKASLPWVTYTRVLGEFGGKAAQARRAYGRFVRAGVTEPPPSPFADAAASLLVGSKPFIARMRSLLQDRTLDDALPQLTPLKPRPSLDEIAEVAAVHFGQDTSRWQAGRRVDDASRAVATYLARRHYGYSAKAVAAAFGYRGHSGVHTALLRIEDGTTQLRKTINHLAKALDKRLTAL